MQANCLFLLMLPITTEKMLEISSKYELLVLQRVSVKVHKLYLSTSHKNFMEDCWK